MVGVEYLTGKYHGELLSSDCSVPHLTAKEALRGKGYWATLMKHAHPSFYGWSLLVL